MIEIVQAIPDDAMTIAKIKISSWKKAYKNLLPASYLNSLDASVKAEKYRHELVYSPTIHTFLVKHNAQSIGVVKVEIANTSSILRDIYLLPEYWNMGFGAKVYNFVISFAKGKECSSLIAWILEGNIRAQKLAIKVGFVATEELSVHITTEAKLRKYTYTIDQNC